MRRNQYRRTAGLSIINLILNRLMGIKTGTFTSHVKPVVMRDFSKFLNSNKKNTSKNDDDNDDNNPLSQAWFLFIDNNFQQILNGTQQKQQDQLLLSDVSVAEIEEMLDLLETDNPLLEQTIVAPINYIFEAHSFDMYRLWKQKFAPVPLPSPNNARRYREFMAEVN